MPRNLNDVFPFNQSVATDIPTCKIVMLRAIPEFNRQEAEHRRVRISIIIIICDTFTLVGFTFPPDFSAANVYLPSSSTHSLSNSYLTTRHENGLVMDPVLSVKGGSISML